MLEIGPSAGVFCYLAKESGFDVEAIEVDADCVRFLREELGIPTIQSNDPASVLKNGERSYDAICLWHSIEHIDKPWVLLEWCAARLNPDGVLVVATPNPQALQAAVLGARWVHYDLPRHLFLLPIAWLSKHLEGRGLRTEMVKTVEKTSFYLGVLAWRDAICACPLAQRFPRLFRLIGTAVGLLWSPLELLSGRGAAYITIYRRPAR
jgi:SAM-dependent methyltransferase